MAEETVEQKPSGWHPPESPDSTFPSNHDDTTVAKRQSSAEKQSKTGSPTKDSILRFLEFVKTNSSYEALEPSEGSKPGKGRAFMPYNLIQAYLERNEYKELRSLSSELFQTKDEPPIREKDIVTRYSALYGTLLSINSGRCIETFRKSGIDDTQLPFNPNAPPTNLQSVFADGDLLRKFCEKQWQFCAPIFESPLRDAQFEDDRILPITYKQRLKGRGNATLWKINLHSSYNKLLPEEARTAIGEARADTFVLKTYHGDSTETYYQSKVEAFKSLNSSPSIIPFYGSFTRAGTYNVILEYADKGTLKDLFQREPPPKTINEIIEFWERMLKIFAALQAIHDVEASARNHLGIFQGYHQDIKPANILLVSSGPKEDWSFKLADLGISHFRKIASNDFPPTASTEYTTCGTRDYSAPECYRPNESLNTGKVKSKQHVDIRSFGCVLSEAVRWMVERPEGVSNYRTERRAETSQISGFNGSDCFHNGAAILKADRESHERSHNALRKMDRITSLVISMIDDDMMDIKPPTRQLTAAQLWNKSRQILESAREASRLEIPSSGDRSWASSAETKVPGGYTPLQTHSYSLSEDFDRSATQDLLLNPSSLTGVPHGKLQLDTPSRSGTIGAQPSGHGTKPGNYKVDDGDDATSVTSERYGSVPYMTVSEALEWKMQRKTTRKHQPIANSYLQQRLNGRDHVFIIDDAASMKSYWIEVAKVFEALSYIVKGTDPDGIDIYFTISEESVRDCKTSSKPLQVLKSRTHQGQSDINLRLNSILDNYKASFEKHISVASHFRKPKRSSRPLSVYVLTDGVWESETNPRKPIERVVETLLEAGKDRNQIRIQFISFGNDHVGLERLQALDAEFDSELDIVDTEPSNGNVWKMLLGAINDSFDKAGESTSSIQSIKPAEVRTSNQITKSPVMFNAPIRPKVNAANTGKLRLSGQLSENRTTKYSVNSTASSTGLQEYQDLIPAASKCFSAETVNSLPESNMPRHTKDNLKIQNQKAATTDDRDSRRESKVMDESKLKSFVDSSSRTMKKDLEELLMDEYYQIFDDNKSEIWRTCTGRSSTQRSSSQYLGVQSVSSGSSSSRSQKRIRSSGDEQEEWDDKASRRPTNKKQKETSLSMQDLRRYSCPYHKHNPSKFRRGGNGGNFDACDGQGFKDIGHMKEHLHKAHYEKFKCPRCKILLRSSDFEEHSLALEACHPRPEHEGDPEIGFSHAFDISLKMRKRSSPEHEGIARWVEIYSQLFPNEPVPNPYVGEEEEIYYNSAFQSLRQTRSVNSATPSSVVRARLAGHVDGAVNDVVTQLTRGLLAEAPGVIRDTSDEYLDSFQQSHLGSSGSQIFNRPEAELFATEISGPSNARGFSTPESAMIPNSSTLDIQPPRSTYSRLSEADVSSIFQNDSRQVPLSLDSGYGPDLTETNPPGTSDGMKNSKQLSGTSPSDQVSLNQSQLDGMIKRHLNDALSDMTRTLENRFTQLLSRHLPNSTAKQASIAGPEQVPESHVAGQTEKVKSIQDSGGVSEDTAQTPPSQSETGQLNLVGSDDLHLGDDFQDFGLGSFSPLFDSTSLRVDDAPS